jgi:NTP pyrophosphatase (non-canonical NTP hydrolase)
MSDDMHCYRDDHAIYREVQHARLKAHEKHGENSIEVEPASSPRWLAILVEEVGEIANALTYDGPKGNLRAELVDVLAVGSAWVAAIDREHECVCACARETVPGPRPCGPCECAR